MKLFYSKTLSFFLKKIKNEAWSILQTDMQIRCGTKRFYINEIGYPLHFTLFAHPSKLGYFDPEMYEIGVNKCFLFEDQAKLRSLLQHELAHVITYIRYGPSISHHGKEFKGICKEFGFPIEVAFAVSSQTSYKKSLHLMRKIEKLFALSQSSHAFEAEAAILKARELLIKHQMSDLFPQKNDEEMEIERLIKQKRMSAKMETIATILKHFCVYPVFNYGVKCCYLEILGSPLHVEIGSYIGHFLDHELERLWKECPIKGKRAKNSFFKGIARGFQEKMLLSKEEEQALIPLQNHLAFAAKQIYPHLSSFSARHLLDKEAHSKGKKAGKKLSIHAALHHVKKTVFGGFLKY